MHFCVVALSKCRNMGPADYLKAPLQRRFSSVAGADFWRNFGSRLAISKKIWSLLLYVQCTVHTVLFAIHGAPLRGIGLAPCHFSTSEGFASAAGPLLIMIAPPETLRVGTLPRPGVDPSMCRQFRGCEVRRCRTEYDLEHFHRQRFDWFMDARCDVAGHTMIWNTSP